MSALTGAVMALCSDILPYVTTATSAMVLLAITALFREPPHAKPTNNGENLRALSASFTTSTLFWLLCLTHLMYVRSHIPFVFGQPFIRETLNAMGYGAQTPLVSAVVTFSMMVISVSVSLVVVPLGKTLGLPGILPLAFGMQVVLTTVLAASNSVFVITLSLAAGQTTAAATMPYADLRLILGTYAAFGLIFLVALASTARRAEV